ncbi:MAG: PilC/PilY family type IV pilus protein [Thermoanaerobaculum sp.]
MKKALLLLTCLVPGLALGQSPPQPSLEGVDLMRQVTTQWVRPNLLIVLDISGSMASDMDGQSVGVDGRGGATGAADKPNAWSKSTTTSGCSSSKKKWIYSISYQYPSRMATVKNALGNSVTIWQPPTVWPAVSSEWTVTETTGATRTRKYTSTCRTNNNDPGPPFDLALLPDPRPPLDLVGKNADKINWGLVVYSGNYYSGCTKTELVFPIDTRDSGDVTTLESWLRLQSAGGLPATGWTPTKAGLEFAKTVMQAVKNGGTVVDNSTAFGGQTFTFAPDPKRSCGRTYAVLLVTDGQSNSCNPNNSCWKDPATGRCDGTTGSTCPSNLVNYPAQKAKELWQSFGVRTFAVGVSEEIGPCELNHIAYEGKTDASSPNGDAGFNTSEDPRLAAYAVNDSQVPSPTNPPYAFFTSTAQQFADAISRIIAAMGTGDYVTSAPSVSGAAGVSEGIGLLASVDYPRFQGHLYAYNLAMPSPPFPLLWDAGQVLATGMVNGQVAAPPNPNNGLPRSLWTWKSSGALVKIDNPTSSTLINTLNTICGDCGITPQVVDFMLGNDGTLTGTRRAWLLGAVMNSTPAVVGPPVEWKQPTGLATARKAFQDTYQNRHPLVWVGSSDGMLHAFDLVDGAEILTLIPPDLLAKQVALYQNYQANPQRSPTGQPQLPDEHIYGVANSVRFGDVYFPGKGFRTVIFVTEGPGGRTLHAIDVTHPYPGRTGVVLPGGQTRDFDPDPNYDSSGPFKPLWSYTRTDGRQSWAIPALGMDENEDFILALPGGYCHDCTGVPAPKLVLLDPTNGSVKTSVSVPNLPPASTWVTNHLIADGSIWQTTAKRFQPDNKVNQAVTGDLHGRLWALNAPSWTLQQLAEYRDTTARGAPLYFSTAVAAYPMTNPAWAVYASITGNFYEKSPFINPPLGWLSNPSQFHHSSVRLKGIPLSGGTACEKTLQIDNLTRPDQPGVRFSARVQPTSYPLLLVPTEKSNIQDTLTLVTVYDPDAFTCIGGTYLLVIPFNPATCSLGTVAVYSGGQGASSGFVVGPYGVLFAKSFVGEGGSAYFDSVPGLQPPKQGGEGASVTWWREIQ